MRGFRSGIVAVIMASLSLQSCGTWEEGPIGSIVAAIRQSCDFLPSITSIAALVGAPGGEASDKIVTKVCAEVEKIRARQKARAEADKKITKLSVDAGKEIPEKLPIGTELEFQIDGKTITGLTTK